MEQKQQRPKYLNLFKIRMPVTAVASILHRITGLVLLLLVPLLIYCLALSLRSAEDFTKLQSYLDSIAVKIIVVLMVWGFAHHLFAGLRFLLMDIDWGTSLAKARFSAWLVLLLGIVVLLLMAKVLLL